MVISAKNNFGIDAIKKKISEITDNTESSAFIANERQFEAVVRAYESVEKAIRGELPIEYTTDSINVM